MTIEAASLEDRHAALNRKREPMSPEDIELLVAELEKLCPRIDRICNILLGQCEGFHDSIVDSLQYMKLSMSHIRWHIDHRVDNKPKSDLHG